MRTTMDELKAKVASLQAQAGVESVDLSDEIQTVNALNDRLAAMGQALKSGDVAGAQAHAEGVVVNSGQTSTAQAPGATAATALDNNTAAQGGGVDATVVNAGQGSQGPTDRPEAGAQSAPAPQAEAERAAGGDKTADETAAAGGPQESPGLGSAVDNG
jgi:hypothetical protein